jgi:hypothetical protein
MKMTDAKPANRDNSPAWRNASQNTGGVGNKAVESTKQGRELYGIVLSGM